MADDSVHSASPVGRVSGFGGRPAELPARPKVADEAPPRQTADRVSVHHGRTLGLRLLRERVLAKTRSQLGLSEDAHGVVFAEVVDGEPVAAFLGRLLSAQNQLAAQRARSWPGPLRHKALADALQEGAEETIDLLTSDDPADEAAVAVVVEVLAEFGRRLAAQLAELKP